MADEVELKGLQKNFGHCLIKWTVKMFGLQICKEYWIVDSPEFNIRGPYTTRWKFALSAQSEAEYIMLYLSRVEFDEGPDEVRVDWKVLLLDSSGREYTLKTLQDTFGKNSTANVELPGINITLKTIPQFESIALHIRCQMLVASDNWTYNFPILNDDLLSSVSRDCEMLLTKNHDAVIEVDNNVIGVHKAFLACRNRNLIALLQDNKIIVNHPGIVYKAMKEIIYYLYSGHLNKVVGKPSLSIYECILNFNIEELKQYYVTDRIMISSTIEAEETEFEWVIRNFSKVKENILLSPVLTNGVSNINWRLRLDPKGTGDGQHIAIYAEMVEVDGIKPLDICLQFAIIDTSHKPVCTYRLQKHVEINEYFGYDKFICKNYLVKYLSSAGDTLRLAFKSQISKDVQSSSIDGYVTSFLSEPIGMHSYEKLMLNLRSLCTEGFGYEDIALIAEEEHIVVHKCILSARSRGFAAMISSMTAGQEQLRLPNMNPDTLHIILNFFYCYELGNLTVLDLLEAHEAAKVYVIPLLQQTCVDKLEQSFLVDDVYDILNFAHRTNDRELTEMVLKAISINAGQFSDMDWRRLATINEALYNNVRRVYEAALSLNQ